MLPTVFMKSFDQQSVERTLSMPARPATSRPTLATVEHELSVTGQREATARAA